MARYAPAVLAPRYLFKSTWVLPYPPDDVYQALYDVVSYPLWWPEFREVTRATDLLFRMVVRSFLPYRITYMLRRDIADLATGRLEATVDGDISGVIGWMVTPGPAGTTVRFREIVECRMELLNLLAPIARWAFEFNHQLMMRDGLVGLKAYLAGEAPKPAAPGVRQPGETFR
jgi:hypothetical protein